MNTGIRLAGLRLLTVFLALATLALAGFWYWSAGRSEQQVPEGAYLVEVPHLSVEATLDVD